MSRRPRRLHAESMASALGRMLRRSGLEPGVREQRALALWPAVVGPALATVTEPVTLRQGRLTVRVEGAAWRSELHHLLPEVLARLNAQLEKPLLEIKLVSGRVQRPPTPRGLRQRPSVDPDDSLDQLVARAEAAARRSR